MNNNIILKESMAEFIGTFMILAFGAGSVAMFVLFSTPETSNVVNGGYTNIVMGWALGVSFGVICSLRISGAHLNPAVTFAMLSTGRFPANKVWYYLLSQILGAMAGAAVVFITFYGKWIEFDSHFESTAGIFATFPAVKGVWYGVIDQVVGTFLLVYLILALGLFVKNPTENIAFPFLVGAIVLVIGISFGGMHGYAINPARDFGPRLFALLMGFKNTGFESSVFIVPIIGPIIGGILGAKFFDMTIKEN